MQKQKTPVRFQEYQFAATKEEAYVRAERSIQQFYNKNLTKKKDGVQTTPEELLSLITSVGLSPSSDNNTLGRGPLMHTASTMSIAASGNMSSLTASLPLSSMAPNTPGATAESTRAGMKEAANSIDFDFQMSYTQLVALPPSIYSLIWIQKLVLTHHNIKTLSEDIGRLQQLQVLILENNRLTSLPAAIGELINLKRLEADNNHLVSLCSLERLSKLEVLSLNNNKLTLLPTSIASLASLRTLAIKSNPIITPPSTVVSKGLKDIVAFLRELETGARPCLRSKLIVVGDCGVGKTSVIQCIKGKKKKSTSTMEGIEIEQYEFDAVFDDEDKKRRTVTVSTWDITNQEVYFATNQLFVSDRSAYVIVWDLTKTIEDSNIEYWLHCITSTAPNSPIILVGTHIDAFDNIDAVNNILESIASRFQKRFPNIQAIISVSTTTGYDVDKLRTLLEDIIKTASYLRVKVPSSFFTLEEALLEVRKKRIPPIMMWPEYINLANICNLKDAVTIQRATEFLHNIGSIVYFNDTNSTVGKMVILDHQWIINCMSALITSRLPAANNRNGVIRTVDLPNIWKAPAYPDHLHSVLLQIMQAFEITYPLSQTDLAKGDEINEREVSGERHLVPNLLADSGNIVNQWEDFNDPDVIRLNRQYHLPFIPDKFFGKLIIRLIHFVKVESCLKRAVIVKNSQGHEALIELRNSKDPQSTSKVLTVDVRGLPTPVSLLRIVTDTIESLFAQWYKLDIKRSPSLFTIEECELAVMDGKTVLNCFKKAEEHEERTAHRLKLDILAPDIAMLDIPRPRFDLKDVKLLKEVGRGAFGIVYEAEWDGEIVALKKLIPPTGDSHDDLTSSGHAVDPDEKMEDRLKVFREFRHEVYSMARLNHPNVMKISGFCIQPLCMALEYVKCGSLYSILASSSIDISWGLRLQIASEIAKGMQHLHSHNPPIIHRDLKSPNILMHSMVEGPGPVSTIIDYGTSTALYGGAALARCVDQPLWLAPEVMAATAYSEPSDVYAFGIILWELYSRSHPYDEFSFGQWMSKLEDEIIRGLRPTIPSTCPPEYAELIQSCWTHEPNSRPTFTTIVETISNLKIKLVPLQTLPPHMHARLQSRKSRSSSFSETMMVVTASLSSSRESPPGTLSGMPPVSPPHGAIGTNSSAYSFISYNPSTSSSSLSSSVNTTASHNMLHHSPSSSEINEDVLTDEDLQSLDMFTEEEIEQPYAFTDDDQHRGIVFGFDDEQMAAQQAGQTLASQQQASSVVTSATLAKMIEIMTRCDAAAAAAFLMPPPGAPSTRKRSDTNGKNLPPPQWRNSLPLASNAAASSLDETFVDDFIYVYRSFTTPAKVFKMLVKRFFGPRPDHSDAYTLKKFDQKKQSIRMGVINFLKKWCSDITELEYQHDDCWLYHKVFDFTNVCLVHDPPSANAIISILASYENISKTLIEMELSLAHGTPLPIQPAPPMLPTSLSESWNGSVSASSTSSSQQQIVSKTFLNLAIGIRDPLYGVPVRERKIKGKTLTRCFTGCDCIDWLMKITSLTSREDGKTLAMDLHARQFFYQLSEEGAIIVNANNRASFYDAPNQFYMFLDDDTDLIAHQYTFLELKLMKEIHPRELLGFAVGLATSDTEREPELWKRRNFPHIYEYNRWFTKMSLLIASEIVKQRDVRARADQIDRYIRIALEYLSLWNFNGIAQVLSALHSEAIARLAGTWARVSPKSMDAFHELSRLMLPESNFLPLRTVLAAKPPTSALAAYPTLAPYLQHVSCPVVPFLGALIADLSQSASENDTFVNSGGEKMVNVLRVKRLARKMRMFKEYRESPPFYKPALTSSALPWFALYMAEMRAFDYSQIDRLSEIERKLELEAEPDSTDPSQASNDVASDSLGFGNEELGERDWSVLLTNATVITYNRGDIVIEENTINSYLYRIKSGSLTVEKKNKDTGKLVKVASMSAPKMFGEMSFLGNKTTARVVVEEQADLYVMDIPFLNNLFVSHPRLGAKFYKIIANQLAMRLKNLPWSKPSTPPPTPQPTPSSSLSTSPPPPLVVPILPLAALSTNTPPASPRTSNPFLANVHPALQQRTTNMNLTGTSTGSGFTPRGEGGRSNSVSRTMTSSSLGADPILKKNDQEFCQRFSLYDEIVIKDYVCSLNRTGRLYISQGHVCFYSKFFGLKTKKVIPFKQIEKILCANTNQIELARLKNSTPTTYRFTFQSTKDRQDAYGIISSLGESAKQANTSVDLKNKMQAQKKQFLTLKPKNQSKADQLTKEDWELIGREGSRCHIFKKDDTIVRQGDRIQKIFQIGKGVCRIVKSVPAAAGSNDEPRTVTLGTMKQDETFGEITYLLSGEVTATVVADSQEVEVYAVEG
eukprot:gene4077-4749_t